jgi:hypothetical protein
MTDEEALRQLAEECPRKIMYWLHTNGQHVHYTTRRFPGKVLCFHCDSEVPDDCELTPAQAHFMERGTSSQATG